MARSAGVIWDPLVIQLTKDMAVLKDRSASARDDLSKIRETVSGTQKSVTEIDKRLVRIETNYLTWGKFLTATTAVCGIYGVVSRYFF